MPQQSPYDPELLGKILTATVGRILLDGPEPLAELLIKGALPRDPFQFYRELYLFALISQEIALTIEAPPSEDRVRSELRRNTLDALNFQLQHFPSHRLSITEWDEYARIRFDQYAHLVPNTPPHPAAQNVSTSDIGLLVLQNIGSTAHPIPGDLALRVQLDFAAAVPSGCAQIRHYRSKAS